MRARAAGFVAGLTLATLVPRVASAQQKMTVAPVRPPVGASTPRAAHAVPEMRSLLRHVEILQELYWTEHGTYTADLAALRVSAADGKRIVVTAAGREGWSARAVSPALPGRSCVITVASSSGRAAVATARRADAAPATPAAGAVVCDRA